MPARARADLPQPYIPASFYPSGSQIRFDANLSDQGLDAQWDRDAAGDPLMHSLRANDFLRQSGWMEEGFVQRGKKIAWFLLFDSSYGTFANGDGGNLRSFLDLQYMLKRWWHAKLALYQPENMLPDGSAGQVETRIIPKVGNGPFVVTSIYWGGKQEIESMGFSSPHLLSRTKLRTMLYAQVRLALSVNQASGSAG